MKEVLIVSIGSFFGGGLRYWISKMVQSCSLIAFPFGTMTVNVLGCFIIGFLSGISWNGGGWMNPSTKLLLTTGFCGGFTTFSTFCNENLSLMRGGHAFATLLYAGGSVMLGFIAVAVGYWIAERV